MRTCYLLACILPRISALHNLLSQGLNGSNRWARSKAFDRAHLLDPFNPWLKNFLKAANCCGGGGRAAARRKDLFDLSAAAGLEIERPVTRFAAFERAADPA